MSIIVTKIMSFAVYLINVLGYPGIFVAGSLEFLGLPVSGEVLIPLIGFMVKKGGLSIITSTIILTIGSVAGTLVMYGIGYYFNNWTKRFIKKKLFKYEEKIDKLSLWMKKNGSIVSFFARFMPFIRVYVSLVAGVERVPIISFTVYSTIGITIWNVFFMVIGYYLGNSLGDYKVYLNYLNNHKLYILSVSIIMIIIIIGFTSLLVKKYRKNKR